jgi:hypothetical protein
LSGILHEKTGILAEQIGRVFHFKIHSHLARDLISGSHHSFLFSSEMKDIYA